MPFTDPIPPEAERWKAAALELACAEGLAALSTRSLAAQMGGSASAISYYFGNRDALISEVCAQAIAASEAWRSAHRRLAAMVKPIWLDFPGAFVTALQARLESGRYVLALLHELGQEAVVSDRPEIRDLIAAEERAEAAFWSDFATDLGASHDHGELWADLALALTLVCMSVPTAAQRSFWITEPVFRLHRRLARRPVDLVDENDEPLADFVSLLAPRNETAARIVDAALRLVSETGADRLKLRDVAARADVSLSAVTYFFGPKIELLKTAFDELCRRDYLISLDDDLREREYGDPILTLSAAKNHRALAAMGALWRSAIRYPDLAPVVDRMLTIRGIGSEVMLRKLGLVVDRLDGYLWISLVSGTYRRIFYLSDDDRTAVLRERAPSRLRLMFGFTS